MPKMIKLTMMGVTDEPHTTNINAECIWGVRGVDTSDDPPDGAHSRIRMFDLRYFVRETPEEIQALITSPESSREDSG